jgi:hypothetical protein
VTCFKLMFRSAKAATCPELGTRICRVCLIEREAKRKADARSL